ncbi:MAG: hypothetical protein IE933_02330 [Sphingomonadales bacterium]|nr:hypothetical protein [Sphingomonadales bacterium]MBD3772251.1 hypothetical protein [Paracoccaceae bacterium]
MKKLLLFAAVASLAACSQSNEDAPPPPPDDTPAAPATAESIVGTYEETTPEGKVLVTDIKADGTYTESIEGKVTESGSWTQADGKDCFDPEGDDTPARCFTATPMAEDGTFTATNEKGESITVKKTG